MTSRLLHNVMDRKRNSCDLLGLLPPIVHALAHAVVLIYCIAL